MKVIVPLVVLGLSVAALVALRLLDWRADHAEWMRLAALQPVSPPAYHPELVADLPEPARRFFNFAITPGTPLLTVSEIEMGGHFSLGSREKPHYRSMQAHQILAAPHGFVWKLRLSGFMPVSGSDSGGWTRFRILGLIPVARLGGNPDHTRSAYGRYVAESVFWAPAALLPGPGVVWEGTGTDSARVIVRREGLSQAVDVTVNAEGRPVEVSFMRWSDANPDRTFRLQRFGGKLSDFREVQGYRLPFRVDGGNMYGTDAYFPFLKAEVDAIRFPGAGT